MTKRRYCKYCGEYSAKRKICLKCKEELHKSKPVKKPKPKKFISPEEALKELENA